MARFEEGNEIGNRFRTNEEATEAGRKGGKASGEAKRRKKLITEALLQLLEMQHKDGRTGAENVAVGQYNKAVKGDTAAAKYISEMTGEYKQHTDITSNGQTINISVKDSQTKEDIDALE